MTDTKPHIADVFAAAPTMADGVPADVAADTPSIDGVALTPKAVSLAGPPTFRLVPPPEREAVLRRDYQAMRDMYLSEPESFERILTTLGAVERRINQLEGRG